METASNKQFPGFPFLGSKYTLNKEALQEVPLMNGIGSVFHQVIRHRYHFEKGFIQRGLYYGKKGSKKSESS